MPVIGDLFDGSRGSSEENSSPPFQTGLKETGFVEGKNVAIEYRFADGRYDRLPSLAAELVGRNVDVIFAAGYAAVAAKTATSTIPIVFATGVDPIRLGLVASLNRPGGNVTGATFLSSALTAKQLELLHQIVPNAATVGFLVNPDAADAELQTGNAQAAARELGQRLQVVQARSESDLDAAFATLVQQHAGALLVGPDPFLFSERDRVADLAARDAIPAMSFEREFAVAGGLASYGASLAEANRQAGRYVGLILKGAKPADLPVIQPTKFDLVINLKAAKALGLAIPPRLFAIIDEVIE
jgi:putative ABC transport system substrate-binding protein